jgi:hypothetical protein
MPGFTPKKASTSAGRFASCCRSWQAPGALSAFAIASALAAAGGTVPLRLAPRASPVQRPVLH